MALSELLPRQQGLKRYFLAGNDTWKKLSELLPRQQGLKLLWPTMADNMTVSFRITSKTTRIETAFQLPWFVQEENFQNYFQDNKD